MWLFASGLPGNEWAISAHTSVCLKVFGCEHQKYPSSIRQKNILFADYWLREFTITEKNRNSKVTESTEEDFSWVSFSGPLSSKGLLRLASQDRACWIFVFPWGHREGLGNKCKPERYSAFSHQKTGKIWSLPPPQKRPIMCTSNCQRIAERGSGLQGAL